MQLSLEKEQEVHPEEEAEEATGGLKKGDGTISSDQFLYTYTYKHALLISHHLCVNKVSHSLYSFL